MTEVKEQKQCGNKENNENLRSEVGTKDNLPAHTA